ncbi:MAG: hypothetical protein K2L12_07060 [Clostridia bacterium]|nr:hypothetical protein [Clostridia bacterium]
MSYRKNSIKSGALSTVLLIVSLIILIGPFGIIMFCVMYYFGGKKQKSLTAKDEEGNVFILTQSSEWSDDYRDQNGDWWKTRDGGKTFEREITVEN